MHILFSIHQFYPWHTSGTERVVITTAKYLKLLGHRVTVVAYSFRDPNYYEHRNTELQWKADLFEGIEVINVRYTGTEWAELNAAIYQPRMLSTFEQILRAVQPDIIHVAHSMRVGTIVWAARNLGIPYVLGLTDFWLVCHKAIMVRDDASLCVTNDAGRACKRFCLGLRPEYYEQRFEQAIEVFRGAAAVIVSSRWLHEMMLQNLGEHPQYKEIPYGVERNFLGFNLRTYVKQGRVAFGFIGTLSAHKGVEVLLSAIERLQGESLELHVWGDGPLRGMVEDTAARLPVVKYHGTYDKKDTRQVLQAFDVGIVPSTWYENNPIILQEMLATNIPVIVSATGGLTELVRDGVNGFHVRLGDAEDLAARMKLIAGNPAELNRLKVGRDSAITTVEQQALQYLAVYEEAGIHHSNTSKREPHGI